MGRRRWRAWEIEELLHRFPSEGAVALAASLDRSVDSVTGEARRLGLKSLTRRKRQALSRAEKNRSLNIRFFEALSSEGAFALGFIWATGSVKCHPPHVIRLRCPASQEATLMTVRKLLGSRHSIQRRGGSVICELSSYWLVNSLIRHFGCLQEKATAASVLTTLPPEYIPSFVRGYSIGRRKPLPGPTPECNLATTEAATPAVAPRGNEPNPL